MVGTKGKHGYIAQCKIKTKTVSDMEGIQERKSINIK